MDKKKILVIDDEEDFLTIVKLNLESTGRYDVMTLFTGQDVLATAEDYNPDIILLDMLMPKVKGLEVCDLLKTSEKVKDVPVIIISALEKEDDKESAYEKGVIGYLTKPVDKETLITEINKVLNKN